MRQQPLILRVRVWMTDSVDNIYLLVVEAGKWVPGCLGQSEAYRQSSSIVTELSLRDLHEVTDGRSVNGAT